MGEVPVEALQEAIRHLHGCESSWVRSVPVTEISEGRTVWEGVVHVFDLAGHPTAKRAYAWSHAIDGSDRQRFVAVLHVGLVNSPEAAVRAAIVQEMREGRAGHADEQGGRAS